MVVGWLTIGISVFILLVVIFKTQDLIFVSALLKKNLFFILFTLIFLFVSFSLYRIYVVYNVNFLTFDGIVNAGKIYLLWIKGLFVNLGKITGYIINQDWFLKNPVNISLGS